MRRLTIDFGVSAADGFHPEVIRRFTLEPNPAIFTVATVVHGWGGPTVSVARARPTASPSASERSSPAKP
jgi:hypothetical protein